MGGTVNSITQEDFVAFSHHESLKLYILWNYFHIEITGCIAS